MLHSFVNFPMVRVRFQDDRYRDRKWELRFLFIERSRKVSLWTIFRSNKLSIWISQTLVHYPAHTRARSSTSCLGVSGHSRYREAVKHASLRTRLTASRLAGRPGREIHFPLVKFNNPDPVRILSRRRAAHVERTHYWWLTMAVRLLNGMKLNQESSSFPERLFLRRETLLVIVKHYNFLAKFGHFSRILNHSAFAGT